PDLFSFARELERRDVTLDAIVIRGERRRARELDRPVLADKTAARGNGCSRGGEDRRNSDYARNGAERARTKSRHVLPSGVVRCRPVCQRSDDATAAAVPDFFTRSCFSRTDASVPRP